MKFPTDSVYTSNQYRAPYANLTLVAKAIAYDSDATNGNELAGDFHKRRFFGHHSNTAAVGSEPEESEDDSSTDFANRYPTFWRTSARTVGNKLGISHHLAEIGPGSTSTLFSLNGRSASNFSGTFETITNRTGKNSSGMYFSVNGSTIALRTPFHAKFNVTGQYHDYPRAKYSSEPDFKIVVNGQEVNPLSRNSVLKKFGSFVFSPFRHYGKTNITGGLFIKPNNPATNPKALTNGSWGHDYIVTSNKPIERINWNTDLTTIQTWSPYSKSRQLDFLNGQRYNQLLHSSSIWSK